MNRLITAVSALAVACAAASALADTLTWQGGLTNAFSSAASWTSDGDHATPQPGDTVKFASKATLTKETFDLGSGTLTFDVSSDTVTSLVDFTGVGALAKTGGGTLLLNGVGSTYSGGATVLDGVLKIEKYVARTNPANGLGTGPVTVARASGRTPCLSLAVNATVVTNAVRITGPFNSDMNWQATTAEICFGNNPYLYGPITSEGSFRIANSWAWDGNHGYGSPVLGPVTVTGGGTLYAHNAAWFANAHDGSVVVKQMGVVWSDGKGFKPCGGLYFGNGYTNVNAEAVITNAVSQVLQFNDGSHFAGREVVAKGAEVTTVINGASCFGDATVVKLLDGAILKTDACVCVPRLVVDGTEVPVGVYTASNFPVTGRLVGSGVLCVGIAASSVSTWTGGSLGTWTDAANWDNGVPSDGQVAVFNSGTTITNGTVNIGEGGLTVLCNAQVKIVTNATFTGVGKLTKAGAKVLYLENYLVPNTYAGGTDILRGTLEVAGNDINKVYYRNSLGPGPVTIYRAAGVDSRLKLGKWMGLTNDVSVVGAYTAGLTSVSGYNTGGTKGRITATDDIGIGCEWVWDWVRSEFGDISAHGHTVRYPLSSDMSYTVAFVGTVDASFEMTAYWSKVSYNRMVYTEGRFVDPDATYSVLGGSNVVRNAGYIACTNVVVGGSAFDATLVLQKGEGTGLNAKAKLTIQGDGRLSVQGGHKVKVAELWAPDADGELVRQPVGIYSSARVPEGATVTTARFLGAGRLRVGDPGGVLIVR